MPEPSATPRRFPRVKVLGNFTGEVSLLHDVTLLNLGEGGARLEHAGRFALGAVCFARGQAAAPVAYRLRFGFRGFPSPSPRSPFPTSSPST